MEKDIRHGRRNRTQTDSNTDKDTDKDIDENTTLTQKLKQTETQRGLGFGQTVYEHHDYCKMNQGTIDFSTDSRSFAQLCKPNINKSHIAATHVGQ